MSSMISLTSNRLVSRIIGPCISCQSGPPFVQLLTHRFRLLSLPTIHLLLFLKVSMPFFIAAHTGEQGSLFALEAFILLQLQYFTFKTWSHNASLSVWNLQLSLDRKAIFLPSADCKPRTPSSLDLITLSHPIQWIFLTKSENPQRNFG